MDEQEILFQIEQSATDRQQPYRVVYGTDKEIKKHTSKVWGFYENEHLAKMALSKCKLTIEREQKAGAKC
jgi:hypothetical protein